MGKYSAISMAFKMPYVASAIRNLPENMGELLGRCDAYSEFVKDPLKDHGTHDRLADSHCHLRRVAR